MIFDRETPGFTKIRERFMAHHMPPENNGAQKGRIG
jgi:hypothetical protein